MTTDLLDIDVAIEESIPTTEETEQEEETTPETEESTDKGGKEDKDGKKPEKPDETKEEGDETDEKTDEDAAPPPKPKVDRVQKRFDEMTREKYRLQRENDELRKQIETREPDLPEKPNPQNYAFDPNIKGSYEEALSKLNRDIGKWEAEVEKIKTDHSQRTLRKVESEQNRYYAKMEKETSVFGNFDTSKRVLHDLITPEMHDALIHEDNATDLFCFLGSHPEIAESVFSLTPYQQSRELAKIALKLRSAVERKKPKVSKAPEPTAKPPKGGGGTPKKDPRKMSAEEWAKDQGYMT